MLATSRAISNFLLTPASKIANFTHMEAQLNVRISKRLRDKVKVEAARAGKTAEIVVSAALSDFFKSWTVGEREKFYTPYLPYARKTKSRKVQP